RGGSRRRGRAGGLNPSAGIKEQAAAPSGGGLFLCAKPFVAKFVGRRNGARPSLLSSAEQSGATRDPIYPISMGPLEEYSHGRRTGRPNQRQRKQQRDRATRPAKRSPAAAGPA